MKGSCSDNPKLKQFWHIKKAVTSYCFQGILKIVCTIAVSSMSLFLVNDTVKMDLLDVRSAVLQLPSCFTFNGRVKMYSELLIYLKKTSRRSLFVLSGNVVSNTVV